ncbi:MAG: SUMF1/EgtB/PvdO family nonheme iron enzyme, partial [Planctomycetales bacterium]|nr:SUMF1/EgtB/PvdO family nonheme iron enzyme [Planctomycetales bacterium]
AVPGNDLVAAPIFQEHADAVMWHRYRHLPIFEPLAHGSAMLGVAAGLKSAVEQVPLDSSVASTAAFEIPDDDPNALGTNPVLKSVLGLSEKDNGAKIDWLSCDRVQAIAEIVTAQGQATTYVPNRPLTPATDFLTAYACMSHYSRLTQRFKRTQLEEAQKFFRRNCFADDSTPPWGSYILNEMQRTAPEARVRSERFPSGITHKQPVPLADDERQNVLLGRGRRLPVGVHAPPVVLWADSGIGKTTLLWRSMMAIATTPDERVPILLTQISRYLQHENQRDLLQQICDLDLGAIDRADRLAWLTRKVARAEIVFLVDALDQTSAHRDNIDAFARHVSPCPILLTLRPEARQDLRANWERDEIEVLPFRDADARRYLEPYADLFFDRLRDSARDTDDVLKIPLILHLLRQMAIDQQFDTQQPELADAVPELRNRYAIYRHVIAGRGGMIDKGLQSLKDREPELRRLMGGNDDAHERCEQLAFWQVSQFDCPEPFEPAISGRRYRDWRNFARELFPTNASTDEQVRALQQLDLLTSLFEERDAMSEGIRWRHRSLLEYFAGIRLAELFGDNTSRSTVIELLNRLHDVRTPNAKLDDWHWTLRFALSHSESEKSARDLALTLIRLGNPWIVFEAIDRDGIALDREIEVLVRWLVHRDWSGRRGFENATRSSNGKITCAQAVTAWRKLAPDLQDSLIAQEVRDASCMDPWLELLATHTSERRWQDEDEVTSTLPNFIVGIYGKERGDVPSVLREFQQRFVTVPGGVFDRRQFHQGAEFQEPISIRDFALSSFVVTNAEFEAFCPSHRRWRDDYSHQNDEPALYVSWYMARAYCEWLTAILSDGNLYRLPTEWEWEWACRWKNRRADDTHFEADYWWGPKMQDELCWYQQQRPRGYEEALKAMQLGGRWHPSGQSQESLGLVDMLGNVWEWCSNPWGSFRVVRGGCWGDLTAGLCRAARRFRGGPANRHNFLGFRVALVPARTDQSRPEG